MAQPVDPGQYGEKLFAEIDRLFDENRAGEAEQFMLSELQKAENSKELQLQIVNELIGYYRQTSEVDRIEEMAAKALELTKELKLTDTIPEATTLLNIANAYRSIGRLKQSLAYYTTTMQIYDACLDREDMRYAGLLNNMSLLYQELGKLQEAYEYQRRALAISEKNGAGFETAVSLANLANSCVALGKREEAVSFGMAAVKLFRERNVYDAHYCAALSALGMCRYMQEEYDLAADLFEEGMSIVEATLGRNLQYEKLKANRDACLAKLGPMSEGHDRQDTVKGKEDPEMADNKKGMDLCREYYEAYGKPMLEREFGEYLDQIAVGLVGEGSDCFGYDDETSEDHDWGPDFCIWISRELYDRIGAQLEKAYEALPREFQGKKRATTARGAGRRGVLVTEEFYKHFLGTDKYRDIDWRSVEDSALAAVTNGEVFADPCGTFSALREQLKAGYPEGILYLKLAQEAALFSQTGQYNAPRMLQRGDVFTARLQLGESCKHAMRLWHLCNNTYPPHDKWLKKSTLALPDGETLVQFLEAFLDSYEDVNRMVMFGNNLGDFFAENLYAADYISDIDNYLDAHAEELCMKGSCGSLSDKELVDRIVRLEFQAFDKVKNEGGRASCQNDWPTFSVMRKSQYLTWNRTMLLQYLYDFDREFKLGHNLITEKYGRMMESTAPDRYAEIEQHFPALTEEKKQIIEQIVAIQMSMAEEFAKVHPKAAGNARSLHTYEDNIVNTSYETYLRGEISTYSDKMLQLYGRFVANIAATGGNLTEMTIGLTAKLCGYKDVSEMEKSM